MQRLRIIKSSGFTLIELMITVAIVGVLAAVAFPSYTQYIIRSNRAAAEGYMLEVTSLQQRYLLDARAYAGSMATLNASAPSNVSPNYTVDTTAVAGPPPSFTVTATPIGNQLAKDTKCGVLVIDSTGAKFYQSTLNDTAGVSACWQQ